MDLSHVSTADLMMEIAMRQKTTSISKSTNEHKDKQFQMKLSPSWHRKVHGMTVPVSFMALPILVEKLWQTFVDIGGEEFKKYNSITHRNIFKKVMLILAEAKVCCAQHAISHKMYVDLPHKDLFFHEELFELNDLAKKLPYPLASYLDCLGNTMDGELNVIPVLAELKGFTDIAGAISGGPRRLAPLLNKLRQGIDFNTDVYKLAKDLKALPGFDSINQYSNGQTYSQRIGHPDFWLSPDGSVQVSNAETKIFQEIINCFEDKNFNIKTDLLKGQGTMAQMVRTPEWRMEGPFRYFCMTDISEYDQKLGATFGFGFTLGRKIQNSRYGGSFETAYWQGEVVPHKMLMSMLNENSLKEQEQE